jgi:hypothetical protein
MMSITKSLLVIEPESVDFTCCEELMEQIEQNSGNATVGPMAVTMEAAKNLD